MSYLDVPRLHFGGTFFTNPSTINNVTTNYAPAAGRPGDPLNKQWYADGLAQFFLRGCRVNSFVNPCGRSVGEEGIAEDVPGVDASRDPLLAARVRTPSPYDDVASWSDELPSTLAKIVDLDPDQQMRTALYGLWLVVTFPGADGKPVGFYGQMSVPDLRDLGTRLTPPIQGAFSHNYGGVWQGVIRDVRPLGTAVASPLLQAFFDASRAGAAGSGGRVASGGLSVKLTVDLFQPQSRYLFCDGNQFGYGRVLGTIGPHYEEEPEQFVLGRRLSALGGQLPAANFVVHEIEDRPHLSVDLGNSLWLRYRYAGQDFLDQPLYDSEGALLQASGYRLIIGDPAQRRLFPLRHGDLSFVGLERRRACLWKNHVCQINSGIFTLELTPDEAARLADHPLGLQLDGRAIFLESADGFYVDVTRQVARLQKGYSPDGKPWDALIGPSEIEFQVLRFGRKLRNRPFDLGLQGKSLRWTRGRGGWTQYPGPPDLCMSAAPATDGEGRIRVRLAVGDAPMRLSRLRADLDSRVNLVNARGPIGDGGAAISVLVWQRPHPAGQGMGKRAAAILDRYAKIYPGMRGVIDIGSEETVKLSAKDIEGALSSDPADAGYMPVTRDLAPSHIGMIVDWLEARDKKASQKAESPATKTATTKAKAAKTADAAKAATTKPPTASADPSAIPYTLELTAVDIAGMPALSSFVFGRLGSRVVLLGGQTGDGNVNDRIYVVDPAAGKVLGSTGLDGLDSSVAAHLQAAGAQFIVDQSWLFVLGGAAPTAGGGKVTFPRVTALELAPLMDRVASGDNFDTDFGRAHVATVESLAAQVTNGGLVELDGLFVLTFGQTVAEGGGGTWTGTASNCVRVLELAAGRTGGEAHVEVRLLDQQPRRPRGEPPEGPSHRRDLNVLPAFAPDGRPLLGIYGGVGRGSFSAAYVRPMYGWLTGPRYGEIALWQDEEARQFLSQYRCGTVQIHSTVNGTTYTTFFGGVSQYVWNPATGSLERQPETHSQPFVNCVSTLKVAPVRGGVPSGGRDGVRTVQYLLPDLTMAPASQKLSAPYLGKDMAFVPAGGGAAYDNGVIRLDAIDSRQVVGHLIGGIAATAPDSSGATACACSRVYAVTLLPQSPARAIELTAPRSRP